jgi:nucleoside-diphosphate-sugar epimerase
VIESRRNTRIAVTGAGGFVGSHLVRRLVLADYAVRALVRAPWGTAEPDLELFQVNWQGAATEWAEALRGVDVVVHLAARTHAIHERGKGSLDEYRRVNVGGTQSLAAGAVEAGVRRLIFVSTIKVNGECTEAQPYRATDSPAPEDPYGVSKWEAEQVLAQIAGTGGIESVIIRPPLIYGRGVKGNFARLCRMIRRGYVLPFGAIDNRRSLVSVENLVDLVSCCITHTEAAGKTFLVSDDSDLSTPQLIRSIAAAMGTRARLIAVPPFVLRTAGRISGRSEEMARLLGSLQVDIEHTRRVLSWSPATSVSEGLRNAVSSESIDWSR